MNVLFVNDEVRLDASRFSKKKNIYPIALVVGMHAEKLRTQYRSEEEPGVYPEFEYRVIERHGPLTQTYWSQQYWSDFVPWYEWISEPIALRYCAKECDLEIWQLAQKIADEIRPKNWQVFSWMAMAYQSSQHSNDLLKLTNEYASQHRMMLKKQQSGARIAGLISGKIRRENAKVTPEEIHQHYQVLMATGTEKREVAGKLARRFGCSADYIRKIYKKSENTRD
jgi:hypothetical protein